MPRRQRVGCRVLEERHNAWVRVQDAARGERYGRVRGGRGLAVGVHRSALALTRFVLSSPVDLLWQTPFYALRRAE